MNWTTILLLWHQWRAAVWDARWHQWIEKSEGWGRAAELMAEYHARREIHLTEYLRHIGRS